MELRDRRDPQDLGRPGRRRLAVHAGPHHPGGRRGVPGDHAFEPDSRLAIRGDLGPFHGEITYLLVPAVDGATALTNTMDLQASGPTRLIAPLAATRVKNAVAANLDALKQLLEKD